MKDNKYYQLVEDLQKGELTLNIVCLAICQYVRQNERIPEGARNLLTAKEGRGYIPKQFEIMRNMIGTMELAYRRGEQEGQEKIVKKGNK